MNATPEPLAGASPHVRKVYDCQYTATPPAIDADLSDGCWSNSAWATLGQGAATGTGTQALANVRLLWDDVHLYFAAEITDATPRREQRERDAFVWNDDCFEIYLSPDPDSGGCYEMDFNSAGAIFDALRFLHHTGRDQVLRGWTAPSLEVRTKPREGGWAIEGRVRFDEFVGADRVPPLHNNRWPANMFYIDTPLNEGKQALLTWNPTEQFNDVKRFGVLRFVDWEGHAQDQRAKELARLLLSPARLAQAFPMIKADTNVVISSKAAGPYPQLPAGAGWCPKSGFGRVTAVEPEKGELACWRVRPNSGSDPTLIDLVADRDGVLVILGRMPQSSVALIEQGRADGMWLRANVQERSSLVRLRDTIWRAAILDVRQGEHIRLTADAGPAQNLSGDSAQVAVLLAPRAMLDDVLPAGWKPIGEQGMAHLSPPGESEGRECLSVTATDHFTGARRDLPATPGTRLYKVTGQVRGELSGTTRAHVGIDFLDKDGRFIRQATTRVALQDQLRWGLHNFGGTSTWSRFVAHAYDVPPDAATLALWLGVNAWEAPDAEGRAWFSDIKVEPVQRDEAFPLGFPPLTWTPVQPVALTKPSANGGYILSRTPITTYQLPSMPPPRRKDDLALDVLAWPDSAAPVSFSIHALAGLDNVRIEVSDLVLKGKTPFTIPSARLDVRKVCYLYRKRDLMLSDEYLLSPNHLEPFETLAVASNMTQQCWLTIHVPADAAAGRYQGTVRIVPAGASAKTLELTLNVVPVQPQARPGILMGFYCYYLKNETPADLRAMFSDMRSHGMTATFQFNGALNIPIERSGDGRPVIRWDQPNQLRELFDTYRDAGFTEPLLFIAPKSILDAARQFGGDNGAGFAAVYRDLFAQVRQQAAVSRWPAFCVTPYDEGYPYPCADVRFELTRSCAPALRAAGVPVALHSLNHPTRGGWRFERVFEYWTDVILQTFCHPPICAGPAYRGYDSWTQYRDAMHSDGKRVLYYNPDTTGVHPEAMRFVYGVGLWQMQADGVMNWHYNEHARGEAYTLSPKQGSAPMDFVFPAVAGHAGGPTIGWEAAREGVKDYQLLYTLDRLIAKARQSPNADLRRKADQASEEVARFLNRLRFDTIDPVGTLALGRWDGEEVDGRGIKRLHGQYKIPNGFAMEDYDSLRQLVCDRIVELAGKQGP